MKNNTTKKITVSALLIAADVLLTRVLAINTPVMKIGLGFIAVALSGALYGPWWAALTGALADLIGSLIFPTGAYFPGFTLTAAITGIIFGLCFYKRKVTWKNACPAAVLNVLIVSYLANSAMIAYLSGSAFSAMLKVRAVQLAVMLPVQAVVLSVLMPAIMKKISLTS